MFSERAEIIGKIIAEFVVEIIRDNLKEELFLVEELFFVEECITQKGINTTDSKISSPTYYTDNWK